MDLPPFLIMQGDLTQRMVQRFNKLPSHPGFQSCRESLVLTITFMENRKHLPVIELRRVA